MMTAIQLSLFVLFALSVLTNNISHGHSSNEPKENFTAWSESRFISAAKDENITKLHLKQPGSKDDDEYGNNFNRTVESNRGDF